MLGEFVVCYEFAQQIYVVKLIPRNGTQAVPYEWFHLKQGDSTVGAEGHKITSGQSVIIIRKAVCFSVRLFHIHHLLNNIS